MISRKVLPLLAFVVISTTLGACSRQVFNDHSVVGPDLPAGGPFAGHEAVLSQSWSNDGARSLSFVPGQDTTVVNFFGNTDKPYSAASGAWAFTPIIAERNVDAHRYWLLSFNLSRTPDRANYLILRYPADLEIASGLSSDSFEYMSLSCSDVDVARRKPESYAPVKEGQTAPDLPLEVVPEAGACEFNSQHEAKALAPLILKKYDQIKHYEDAPEPSWQSVHVAVK